MNRREIRPTQSGELRHVGNLEQLVSGTDSTGVPTSNYVLWAENVFFAIDDWKSTEAFNAAQVQGAQTTRIRIRYRPGVVATMRLVYCTNPGDSPLVFLYYEIVGPPIRDITLRNELQLMCIQRDAAGFRTGATP